ncbi:MAG: tRNA epoxyqueuosine(34) reductase QueG [FCB group bacterium]|jgi:epoxyqueuosine reductase
MELKTQIINHALEIGFFKAGIAKAEPLEKEMEYLRSWLSNGYNASLEYAGKNLDKKLDVKNIFPEAKSVIVLAQNYYHPIKRKDNISGNYGKLARYAAGDDYHTIIMSKLEKLTHKIQELVPNSINKCFVDSGVLLEKQWAVRAGIGWQGKNGLIVTRTHGSWLFLGIIISSIELGPDKPEKSFCGTCTKCIDTCPTCAIVKPKVIDANKCLSYWNIESKNEEIPNYLKEHSDCWLYGCDTCQDVCPWNKFAQMSSENRFAPRNGETELELETIFNMTETQFKERFANSAILRRKLEGLKRNAEMLK